MDVAECGGLCSYYAEQGGLMVGYEDGKQSKRVFDIASKPGLRVWLAFFEQRKT